VTERKPVGVSWESWIDRQIREAQERGEFDNLPGRGRPIDGLDRPHDEMWWVRQWLKREEVSVTPPTLALRKAVDDLLDRVASERSELKVRELVAELNAQISDTNAKATSGPPSNLMPLDVEAVVAGWTATRPTDPNLRQ
jgi:hypothetical protein